MITNEINSKLYDLMKPHLFNEMYENILVKYFSEFYKNISNTNEFTDKIKMILSNLFKVKNHFNSDSIINLENYMQQTFISRLTTDIDNSLIAGITSDNILQKNDLNNI